FAVVFVLSFILSFILTPAHEEESEAPAETPVAPAVIGKMEIEAPIPGEVIPLTAVKDETFASGVLGEGYAIVPSEGKVYAPFDGTCENLFDTLHAMGLVSNNGVELLIHVGLETVGLGGKPFTAHIKTGDTFKKGDLLLEFDIDAIRAAGCEIQTPIIVTNAEDVGGVTVEGNKLVVGG
ncbi:MAG: glucose PTS transporter subunit IIA, partial [Butyricicoccus sp.]|nr:glucose PTS transporter subunit IIA [Butyricicoccus sp.]